jgi:hypothetical protein
MFRRVLFPTDFSGYSNAVFAACLSYKPPVYRGSCALRYSPHITCRGIRRFARDARQAAMERDEALNIDHMALKGRGLHVKVRS